MNGLLDQNDLQTKSAHKMPSPPLRRALLQSALIGALLGLVAPMQGTPWFATPLIIIACISVTLAIYKAGARTQSIIHFMSDLPKATRFLLVAFFVTSIFALELRFDFVPNKYGFLELLIPVAFFAVFFNVTGGLFCAALTIAYAFQALAPPRFTPVLEPAVSHTGALLAFTGAAIASAVFFAQQAQHLRQQARSELDALTQSLRSASQLVQGEAAHFALRFKTLILPACAIILVYTLVWASFATLSTGGGLHGDSLEAYAWGREFSFGYYKHPPFWSWVAGAWFAIFPKTNFSFWFLSELNGAIGLAGAWALIGRFANRRMQVLGVLLLMLTPFYQFNAQRFNANTILLSIWPWTLYFFVRSLEMRRVAHALICGVLAGMALLSKYYGAILVATCFFAALAHPSRKDYFRSAAPYVSTAAAFLMFLPHLLWLVRDGFQPLFYLADRIDKADRAIANQYFQFILGNAGFFILPAAVLALARWRGGATSTRPQISKVHGASFLQVLAFAPFVLTLVAGTVGHTALGIPFAVAILSLVPPLLVVWINPSLELASRYARLTASAILLACALSAPVLPWLYLRFDQKQYSLPRDEAADFGIALWKQETGLPLRTVSGERDFATATTFRSRDNVSEFNAFNFRWSPWVTKQSLHDGGLLAICRSADENCNDKAKLYAGAGAKVVEQSLQRQIWTAKGLPLNMTFYIIPPGSIPNK